MQIRGAVLREIAANAPYAQSRPIEITELQLEDPGPTEVLVLIEAASVCHSDLSVVNGSRPRPVPMLLGHEAAGRVIAFGDEVADLDAGQRVVMTFLPRCGECRGCETSGRAPCEVGSQANGAGELMSGGSRLSEGSSTVAHHLGVSAFATHAVVDRRSLVPIDDDVPASLAAVLGCAVLTGGGAILNVAQPKAGDTLAVVGLGGVGLAAMLTALSFEGVRVIAIDPLAAKLQTALALGAHEAMTPDQAAASGVRADTVIEAVGRASVFDFAMGITAFGGTTITVGLPAPDDTIEFSPLGLVAEGRSVVGSYMGSALPSRDIPRFVEMWREGRLPIERLISSTIGLDDLNAAMDDLADGTQLRQVVTFSQKYQEGKK